MIFEPYESLKTKAQRLAKMIGKINGQNFTLDLTDGHSKIGGGAFPLLEMPTRLLCLIPNELSTHSIEERLRSYDPPVIVRLEKNNVFLDVRTIQEEELKTVAQAIKELAAVHKK